jgi:hypothetical protein
MSNPTLQGRWDVKRTGGLLPPLWRVRKTISGNHGWTSIGPLSFRFDLDKNELHYHRPFQGLADALTPRGDAVAGEARLFGRRFGSFLMTRR